MLLKRYWPVEENTVNAPCERYTETGSRKQRQCRECSWFTSFCCHALSLFRQVFLTVLQKTWGSCSCVCLSVSVSVCVCVCTAATKADAASVGFTLWGQKLWSRHRNIPVKAEHTTWRCDARSTRVSRYRSTDDLAWFAITAESMVNKVAVGMKWSTTCCRYRV